MYYLITIEYQPYLCRSFKQTLVISEAPELFIVRNRSKENDSIVLLLYKNIEYPDYLKLKETNPKNDGSYLRLQKRDWSKYI